MSTVKIATYYGHAEVPCLYRRGPFAVTQSLDGDVEDGKPIYCVTHLPTGYATYRTTSLKTARRVAFGLSGQNAWSRLGPEALTRNGKWKRITEARKLKALRDEVLARVGAP